MIYRRLVLSGHTKHRMIVCFFTVVTVAAAVYAGTSIPVAENCLILPKTPFSDGGIAETLVKICFPDMLMICILSVQQGKILSVLINSALFGFRGMVIGCAFKIFVCNSVDYITVLLYLSYVIITLLLFIYSFAVNRFKDSGVFFRIVAYLIFVGGCAVIKLVPMLLL